MKESITFTPRLNKAIEAAAVAHMHQSRKGGDIPYIMHPFSVMYIASQVTDDEDVLIACLFHDILEDVPEQFSREQMLEQFGERVVGIVEGVTKNEQLADWKERSEDYLAHLRLASQESVIVSAADKIHNLTTMLIDYETFGEQLWERFNAGKVDQLWWYQSVLAILFERMPKNALTEHLRGLVQQLETIIEAGMTNATEQVK